MLLVGVNVGIGRCCKLHSHGIFIHHETSGEHGAVVIVLIINGELVVAAHFQSAMFIGNGQPVMRINHIGID